MVQILLTKYWVLAHLLVTAGTLCFDPSPSAMTGVWCAASLFIMMFTLPPILKGESFWLARTRVSQAIRKDVFLYAALLAMLYVGVQLLNGPRELVYEPELKRWLFEAPTFAGFPSSINPELGKPFFAGLVGGLACVVAIRSVLPRKQRLYLLIGMGCLTGVLALGGYLFALITGSAPTFAWLGTPFEAGMLWWLVLCVNLGIALEAFLERHHKTLIWSLAVAFVNLLGAMFFGSLLAMLMVALVVVLYVPFAVVLVKGSGNYPRILWNCVLLLPVLFGILIGLALKPGIEVATFFDMEAWQAGAATFGDQWAFRSGLALEVFEKNPMLGVGPEGLQHYAPFCLEGKLDWSLWRSGGTAWSCDFLRLFATCGLMGTLLLLIPGGMLLGRCMMRWVDYRQHVASSRHVSYSYRYLFVLIGSLVGVLGILIASWFGTPLHTPAVLCLFLIVCACMGGWMPRRR